MFDEERKEAFKILKATFEVKELGMLSSEIEVEAAVHDVSMFYFSICKDIITAVVNGNVKALVKKTVLDAIIEVTQEALHAL